MTNPSLADLIGPKRAEVFREIMTAWLSTSPDERQPIEGRSLGWGMQLLHPGFHGRFVVAGYDDIDALVAVDLLTHVISGADGIRCIEPSPGFLEDVRNDQTIQREYVDAPDRPR